jgi:hypothetical protein
MKASILRIFWIHVFFIIIFLGFGHSQPAPDRIFIVTAKSGLRMRSEASLEGSTLVVIPYQTEVLVTKTEENYILLEDAQKYYEYEIYSPIEIDSKYGNWMKVKWKEKEGWVFSGFLQSKVSLDILGLELLKEIPHNWFPIADSDDPRLVWSCFGGLPFISLYPDGNDYIAEPHLVYNYGQDTQDFRITEVKKEKRKYTIGLRGYENEEYTIVFQFYPDTEAVTVIKKLSFESSGYFVEAAIASQLPCSIPDWDEEP